MLASIDKVKTLSRLTSERLFASLLFVAIAFLTTNCHKTKHTESSSSSLLFSLLLLIVLTSFGFPPDRSYR